MKFKNTTFYRRHLLPQYQRGKLQPLMFAVRQELYNPGKWCACLFFLLFFLPKADAQSLKRECIASSGSSVVNNGTSIHQTLGQPYNTTSYYSNNIRFNPGFQQPALRIENVKSTINAKIFPNPTSNQITLETTTLLENATIQIIDMSGKLLFNEKLRELKSFPIDCSNWSNGIYMITLSDAKSNLYSSKLIISR